MIARTEIDKCFSTALNGHGAFNFDNEERTELSPELARTALDFAIGVRKCYDDMGRAGNISLNRPCGTGTPSSGKIEQKAVLGLR